MTDPRSETIQRMIAVAEGLYVSRVSAVLGPPGITALRRLLMAVRELYRWIPCEAITGGLTVYVGVTDDSNRVSGESSVMDPAGLKSVRLERATILVEKNGQFRIWSDLVEADDLPPDSLGYHFRYTEGPAGCDEKISVRDERINILNPSGFPSAFAVPSFSDLATALDEYKPLVQTPDPFLDSAWRDSKRLAFLPKPERQMRRSLELYLRHALRGAFVSVRPEQNVNETEPVDIEINWAYQGRLAWIEIKWLGHSAPKNSNRWPTSYSASRAVAGARQLADYLTSGADRVAVPLMGYLVVFDARRRGLKPTDSTIKYSDGLHFQLRDIEYPPELFDRPDMATPVRYFIAPRI